MEVIAKRKPVSYLIFKLFDVYFFEFTTNGYTLKKIWEPVSQFPYVFKSGRYHPCRFAAAAIAMAAKPAAHQYRVLFREG